MVAKQTYSQRVYEYLRDRVLNGDLNEGEFLTETAIANDLGVSRTPVREAISRLTSEGLISFVPGRGALVPYDTTKTVTEVMEARILIESHSLRQVCPAPLELTRDLRTYIAKQEAITDPAGFIEQDRRFHQRIIEAAGNSLLADLYSTLRDRQTRIGLRAVMSSRHRPESVIAEHLAIVVALEKGDVDEAAKAGRQHLLTTLNVLVGSEIGSSRDGHFDL